MKQQLTRLCLIEAITKKPEVWSAKFHPFQNYQSFWEEIKKKLKFMGSVRRQHQVNASMVPCSYRG